MFPLHRVGGAHASLSRQRPSYMLAIAHWLTNMPCRPGRSRIGMMEKHHAGAAAAGISRLPKLVTSAIWMGPPTGRPMRGDLGYDLACARKATSVQVMLLTLSGQMEAAACSPAPATSPRRAIVAGSRAALQHMATTPRWHQWQRAGSVGSQDKRNLTARHRLAIRMRHAGRLGRSPGGTLAGCRIFALGTAGAPSNHTSCNDRR